jgi:predicted metal-dependent phosphoesterase TrpH
MHVHTHGSYDCVSEPDAVVRMARARGLARICITDHDVIGPALALADQHPGTVIVGEEIRTAEGVDIIGLFLTERIASGTAARAACRSIRDQGGLVYVPHPFAPGKGGDGRILNEVVDLVDVVEGFNARVHAAARNRRAVDWAARHALPIGAGSDAHTLREVGRGYVDMPDYDGTAAGFLMALRHGAVGGRTSSYAVHAASTWAKVRKRLAR